MEMSKKHQRLLSEIETWKKGTWVKIEFSRKEIGNRTSKGDIETEFPLVKRKAF